MNRAAGAAAGLAAASIWGGMYVVSKYVLAYVPPFTLVAVRLAIAGLVFSVALAVARKRRPVPARRDVARALVCGLVGFGLSLPAQFAGTRLSTAHDGALITSATPAFIALFARPLLGEVVGARRWLALALATTGVAVVAVGGTNDPNETAPAPLAGNALLAAAAVAWALYTVLAKDVSSRAGALAATAYATFAGVAATIPMAAIEGVAGDAADWRILPTLAWAGIVYLGVVSTAVAFYLWNRAFEALDASLASLCFFAQPVVGAVLGWLLLAEILPVTFFAGAIAIVVGVLLAFSPPRRRRPNLQS